MATNKHTVKEDLQEAARNIYVAHEMITGIRNEVFTTGEHILKGLTTPAKDAIAHGPEATLSYLASLSPASQLADTAGTLTRAALGDDAAQAKINHTLAKAEDIATAFPKSLGENTARAELAAKAGNGYEFGGALGAIAMMTVGGPEAKAAEAATISVAAHALEGELVESTTVAASQQIAATSAESSTINGTLIDTSNGVTPTIENSAAVTPVTPVVPNIADPKYTPITTALDNSNLSDQAKQTLRPVANVLDDVKNIYVPTKPTNLTEHMNQAVSDSYKRDNIFKEALDRSDAGHVDPKTGLTIAETTHYNDWNKAQVPKRAQFYNDVFQHNPELAADLEKQGITADGVKNLLMSDVNDHLMGIKPYEGQKARSYTYGYEADEQLAKEWGIEYKKPKEGLGGLLQELTGTNEITLNKELQEAKKAVEAAEALQAAVHQDTAKRIIIPDLPRNKELDAKVQQLLAVQVENGAVSAETRQALPPELRALPAKHLEALQEKAQQAVATDQLRLAAEQQTPLITGTVENTAKTETNITAAANYNLMAQAIKDSFKQSLSAVNNQAPVSEIVPLTDAQIAAKQRVAAFTEGKGAISRIATFTLDSLSGYAGMGYRAGRREEAALAEKAAASDYDFMAAATKSAGRKAATTVAVATAAVVAPAALPVGFAGLVATRMVANNETATAAIKGLAVDAKDYVAGAINTLRSPQRDAVAQALTKSADGTLSPQSQRVLELVDERMAKTQTEHPLTSQEFER